MNRTITERSDEITAQAHMYGARIVCGLHSHKLSLVEKFPEDYGVSASVLSYLNILIYHFNKQLERS